MLLDHFHAPLADQRDWHGFHHAWATYISASLNRQLPERWFAQPHVEFGVEIDVATLEESAALVGTSASPPETSWLPSKPALTLACQVSSTLWKCRFTAHREDGFSRRIELISPANKDRPAARDAFVAKCESLIGAGIGLLLVDIVTDRHANLHELLLERLGHSDPSRRGHLYSSAFHPVQRDEQASVDIWHEELELGKTLPQMPLFLRSGPCIPVDLNETYQRTCAEQRIPGT